MGACTLDLAADIRCLGLITPPAPVGETTPVTLLRVNDSPDAGSINCISGPLPLVLMFKFVRSPTEKTLADDYCLDGLFPLIIFVFFSPFFSSNFNGLKLYFVPLRFAVGL